MFRFIILIPFLCHCQELMCQQDTLPNPAMTPDRLIMPDGYRSDAACIPSLSETARMEPQKKIFNRSGSKFILPAAFIAYGTAARFNQLPLRRLDHDLDREIRKRVSRQYHIDDYFEYGMPVLAYGLDFFPCIDARHNHRDRALVMATSFIVMQGSVVALKKATAVERPGNGKDNSFPSGHTAATMLSAHIMFREYWDVSPWIGVGGYLIATTTGILRMVNGAHWASDVVAGAGIGILSAEIGYMMLPLWHSVLGIKEAGKQFVAIPAIGTKSIGLGLVYRF